MDAVVFGRIAGAEAAEFARNAPAQHRNSGVVQAAQDDLDNMIKEGDEMARPLQRKLRDVMWRNGGVIRNETGLLEGIDQLDELAAAAKFVDVRPSSEGYHDLALALDLRSSLISAEATLRSALVRTESRGAHQRSDYPDLDPSLEKNIIVYLENGELHVKAQAIPAVSEDLQRYFNEEELAVEGRLLE